MNNDSALYGVVPYENSITGSVVSTSDLLADRQREYAAIYICGEAYLDVHHCLLGYISGSRHQSPSTPGDTTPTSHAPRPAEPRTHPLKNIQHIKVLYTHPQAWGQCEAFLSTYLKHAERRDASSTSKAAELASKDPTKTAAAIASRVAAKINGLDILAEGIEDRDDNTTRFLVLRKNHDPEDDSILKPLPVGHNKQGWKTIISFTTDPRSRSAVADAFAIFNLNKLNLIKVDSRPSQIVSWHNTFLVEVEKKDGDDLALLRRAREQLSAVAIDCKWLGTWKNRAREQKIHPLELMLLP